MRKAGEGRFALNPLPLIRPSGTFSPQAEEKEKTKTARETGPFAFRRSIQIHRIHVQRPAQLARLRQFVELRNDDVERGVQGAALGR